MEKNHIFRITVGLFSVMHAEVKAGMGRSQGGFGDGIGWEAARLPPDSAPDSAPIPPDSARFRPKSQHEGQCRTFNLH